MRTTTLPFLLCGLLWASAARAADQPAKPLTNADVVELHRVGLEDAVILEKIKASPADFDVTVKALGELKAAGLSGAVIAEMVKASARKPVSPDAPEPATALSPEDLNDPTKPHAPGIWLWQENGGAAKMVQLTASVVSKIESSWHGPFGSVHRRAVLPGERAALQIDETRPTFYFYFEMTGTSFGTRQSAVTSPNEFRLARAEIKDPGKPEARRRLEIGKFGPWGGSSEGLPEEVSRAFDFEEVQPGVFKVRPQHELERGEYWFIFAGVPHMVFGGFTQSGGKVFDFGIQNATPVGPEPRAKTKGK